MEHGPQHWAPSSYPTSLLCHPPALQVNVCLNRGWVTKVKAIQTNDFWKAQRDSKTAEFMDYLGHYQCQLTSQINRLNAQSKPMGDFPQTAIWVQSGPLRAKVTSGINYLTNTWIFNISHGFAIYHVPLANSAAQPASLDDCYKPQSLFILLPLVFFPQRNLLKKLFLLSPQMWNFPHKIIHLWGPRWVIFSSATVTDLRVEISKLETGDGYH